MSNINNFNPLLADPQGGGNAPPNQVHDRDAAYQHDLGQYLVPLQEAIDILGEVTGNGDAMQTKFSMSVMPADFSKTDKQLLSSGMHADAKVVVGDKVHQVHKSILCTRSKWFRAAFEGGFSEGNESVVNISDPNDNIDLLLEFLYTGAVKKLRELKDSEVMAAANEIAALGDFYQVSKMTQYAQMILGKYLGSHLNAINSSAGYAGLPCQYRDPDNMNQGEEEEHKTCSENYKIIKEAGFTHRLCEAIRGAYAKRSGIQRIYVAFVCAARPMTFKCDLIRALRLELPEFGEDLLTAMMDGLRCPALGGNPVFEQWKDTLSVAPRQSQLGMDMVPQEWRRLHFEH